MTHLIRSEWIKFRSVRSTVITLLLAGILVVLVSVLTANSAKDDVRVNCESTPVTNTDGATFVADSPQCGPDAVLASRPAPVNLTDLVGGVQFATLIFGVLGVQVIGQEYRFNTIRPTFTAMPDRFRVLFAKLIVVTSACAVVAAVMVAFCWLVGTLMVDGFRVDGVDQRAAMGIVLFTVLWTTAGMGVGAIVRQPIAGIMIIVAESLILETLIGSLFESTMKWLPFVNGIQMTSRMDSPASDMQSVLAGGIYFAVVCAVVWAIGAVLVNKRDA